MKPDALVRLADLRVRQRRVEVAEALLDGWERNADTAGSLADVYLALGDAARASDVLEHMKKPYDVALAPAVPGRRPPCC